MQNPTKIALETLPVLEKIVASGRARYVLFACLKLLSFNVCFILLSVPFTCLDPQVYWDHCFSLGRIPQGLSAGIISIDDRMPHFDRNLASYCFLGVGCHKDKSGHNSYVRQEQEHRPKTVRKPSEGIVKVNFLSRTIFPIFSPRNLG